MKTILIWVGVFAGTVALILGIGYLQNKSETPTVNADVSKIKADDWVRGDRNSKVVVVEYGDFQCPGCAGFEPLIQQLTNELGDKFTFVFRNFPLPQHKNATLAAYAAQAAGQQGKYWEMHDQLYLNQKTWEENNDARKIFEGYATTLGLKIDQYKTDIDSQATKDRIERDANEGVDFAVNSTPTFFVNGLHISPNSYDDFKSAVSDAIAKVQ